MKKVQILVKKLVKNELKSLLLALGCFFLKVRISGENEFKKVWILAKRLIENELKSLILASGFKKKNEYWQKKKHLCFIDYFPIMN